MQLEPLNGVIHCAAPGFEAELASELGDRATRIAPDGPLFLAPPTERAPAWAQNTWLEPVRVRFTSIADAATALISLGRRWALAPTVLHRRAALI